MKKAWRTGESPDTDDLDGQTDGQAGWPKSDDVWESMGLSDIHLEPEPEPETGRLGERLLHRQLITQSQLAEALIQQTASGKRLGELLVELGALDEHALARTLSELIGVPLADLRRDLPEEAAIAMLPESIARARTAIPIRRTEAGLEVAMADPMDTDAIREIYEAAQAQVISFIAPPSDIRRAIDKSYRALAAVQQHVEAFLATAAVTTRAREQEVDENVPVVQVVNLIITQAVRDGASDIHIEPHDSRVRVRFRIDGALHDVLALPANMGSAMVSRVKILAQMNIVERRKPQDGKITMEAEGRSIDLRVSTVSTIWGEKAVMRLLDTGRALYRLGDLGMDEETHEHFSRVIRAPFGMIICAGPTGSGKTTTLYATLAEVNQSELNIMTVEDPVEFTFPSINQIQIHDQAGITFATGLRAILRQDPDVILVGEMRDAETARIGVQSALTGHLVLTSLHATDAAAALERFLDMGIESFLVASAVRAVVGQRLVRRICSFCKAPYTPSVEERQLYEDAGGPPKNLFWHGEGCNFCFRTGYQDRVGVYEILRVTEEMKSLLMKRAAHDELRALAVRRGMRTLLNGGIRLVAKDITTISEVVRSIYTT